MLKRIVCSAVVCSFVMLWPAASAAEDEQSPKMVVLLEELFVFPDKSEEYEVQIKLLREAAIEQGFPYRFDSYKTDDLHYLAVWWLNGSADLDKLWAAWEAMGKKWGEGFADWEKKTFATMSHYETSLWIVRPDLSYMPANEDELKYFVWGKMPIKAGHQQSIEELIKKTIKIHEKHEIPYAWSASEGWIGVDYPTLSFVEWSASPGTYWMRNDALHQNEEFMKEAGAIWEEMTPQIRGYVRETGYYLQELSYSPEMKEAEGE